MTILHHLFVYYFFSYIKTPMFYFILAHFAYFLLEAYYLSRFLALKKSACISCLRRIKDLKKRCRECVQADFPELKKDFLENDRWRYQWLLFIEAFLLILSFFTLHEMRKFRGIRYDAYAMIAATLYFFSMAKRLAYFLIMTFFPIKAPEAAGR